MSDNDDDMPSPQSYETTGFLGVVIFTSIFGINIIAFSYRRKFSSFFVAFFSFISLLCLLELPRYILMMKRSEYESQGGYSCHLMASYLYFLCLTMIAHLWSTFVELGPIESRVYSKASLAFCNVLLLALVLTAVFFCSTAESLEEFFDSFTYAVFTIVELAVNLMYTTCLGFLSVKLVVRFHRYASNASTKVTKNSRTVCQNNDLSDSFKEVMYKVLFSFSFLVICSIIRLGMLFVRLRNNFLDNIFIQYSNAWFVWTDFIPRGLACLALVYLMFYKPIKLSVLFSTRDKGRRSGNSDESTVQNNASMNSSRYREDVEEDCDPEETDNPLRMNSVNYGKRRSSVELKNSSVSSQQVLMTDFFRKSEDFDVELTKAMHST